MMFTQFIRYSWERLTGQRALIVTEAQLQKKFKHALHFGVSGPYNLSNAELFKHAILAHVNDRETRLIKGFFRGQPVTHFYNFRTRLNVIKNAAKEFETGWRLNPAQEQHVVQDGKLGGG